jgi:hypothetical protein
LPSGQSLAALVRSMRGERSGWADCIDPNKGFAGVWQSSGYFGQQRRLGNAIFCRAVP